MVGNKGRGECGKEGKVGFYGVGKGKKSGKKRSSDISGLKARPTLSISWGNKLLRC